MFNSPIQFASARLRGTTGVTSLTKVTTQPRRPTQAQTAVLAARKDRLM
jgi:hypothetical protein